MIEPASTDAPRVLHVIHSLDPATGGPVTGLHGLVDGLRHEGFEPEVVCLDAPSGPGAGAFPVQVHALGPVRTRYGFTAKLPRWLKTNAPRFRAVIINGIWQFHSLATYRALKGADIPYYVFTHGMLDPWFKQAHPLKHLKKWLYWPWAEYWVLRAAEGVLFTCEEERRLARKSFWLYRCREIVLGYGIHPPPAATDHNLFLKEHPQCAGKRLWLFLGRLHPKKGCDQLIEAFAAAARDEPDLHLIMAGPNPVGWQSCLQALSQRYGVESRITWPGMLAGQIKWDALRAAEIFWLPSHQENFGLAIAEALACGVPVLISNRVNIWREVQEDGAGLVEPDTPEGTQRLARRWLSLSRTQRESMRINAQNCYQNRFGMACVAKRLADSIASRRPQVAKTQPARLISNETTFKSAQ